LSFAVGNLAGPFSSPGNSPTGSTHGVGYLNAAPWVQQQPVRLPTKLEPTMTMSVLRIRRPGGDARLVCRFIHQLTVRSGVTVGARRSPSARGQWQIVCPTVVAMRLYAADLGPAVVGVDLDHLIWERTTRV
jgi:hypothetical protein